MIPISNPQELDLRLQQVADAVRQTYGNSANPRDIVQKMLDSGQMSQQQFNQIRNQANQILGTNY